VLGHDNVAASTVGTWLRQFTFGHIRQLGPAPAPRDTRRHAFVTNRQGDMIELDVDHGAHAVIELAIRDLKRGAPVSCTAPGECSTPTPPCFWSVDSARGCCATVRRDLIGTCDVGQSQCWPPHRRQRHSADEGSDMDDMRHGSDYVIVGVDTHADEHVAIVLDSLGEVLGGRAFPATRAGYARLLAPAAARARPTSSRRSGRPRGPGRHRHDPAQYRWRTGRYDPVLHITRETAVKARPQAINQLPALVVTAPFELAEQLRGLSSRQLVATATCFAATSPVTDPTTATELAMRSRQ
jgi:hypothetical protein